ALLSGIKPEIYDACINSCCAFTGDFLNLETCPICGQACHDGALKPWARFEYLPLIPHLQGYFMSPDIIELMSYCATRTHTPGEYSDIFDGSHYQELICTKIIVEGITYPVCHFENPYDIAIGILSDGVQVFKNICNGSATAWPFLGLNYNLSPAI
ncbi:hypothetical protein K439DRAFT_1288978, partial [Ramaria rubella]